MSEFTLDEEAQLYEVAEQIAQTLWYKLGPGPLRDYTASGSWNGLLGPAGEYLYDPVRRKTVKRRLNDTYKKDGCAVSGGVSDLLRDAVPYLKKKAKAEWRAAGMPSGGLSLASIVDGEPGRDDDGVLTRYPVPERDRDMEYVEANKSAPRWMSWSIGTYLDEAVTRGVINQRQRKYLYDFAHGGYRPPANDNIRKWRERTEATVRKDSVLQAHAQAHGLFDPNSKKGAGWKKTPSQKQSKAAYALAV